MNSILQTGRNKAKCQKFTPKVLVNTMLDLMNYKDNLIGKKILENSFGSGNILKEIVVRYIEDAIKRRLDGRTIANGLAHDIYGIELDEALYKECITDLNAILRTYNIPMVQWNLFNENALLFKIKESFDYVIGNPPYISYKEIDDESRLNIKEQYKSCSIGKFDYCYAFIELGVRYLKSTGKLVQLVPNNIYKNVFARNLRNLLLGHISTIIDYPNQKLFDKALTSVSVFLYDMTIASSVIHYENVTQGIKREVARQSLGDKWIFGIPTSNCRKKTRFGDVFHASISVATLCNIAFVVDEYCASEAGIESPVLKNAVSPKTLHLKKQKKIIFPYFYDNKGILRHYSSREFHSKYPNTWSYLKRYARQLKLRNSDKGAHWFEYGRSQALAHLNTNKLLISTIITNEVEVYKLDADTIPFSGIYITVKDSNYSLDDAAEILRSAQFLHYVQDIGISISGKSLRVTCKDINNFLF